MSLLNQCNYAEAKQEWLLFRGGSWKTTVCAKYIDIFLSSYECMCFFTKYGIAIPIARFIMDYPYWDLS